MWVSTAKVSCPNQQFSTTLAVFRPTPGSRTRSSRVSGTFAAIFVDQQLARGGSHFLALELNSRWS